MKIRLKKEGFNHESWSNRIERWLREPVVLIITPYELKIRPGGGELKSSLTFQNVELPILLLSLSNVTSY